MMERIASLLIAHQHAYPHRTGSEESNLHNSVDQTKKSPILLNFPVQRFFCVHYLASLQQVSVFFFTLTAQC